MKPPPSSVAEIMSQLRRAQELCDPFEIYRTPLPDGGVLELVEMQIDSPPGEFFGGTPTASPRTETVSRPGIHPRGFEPLAFGSVGWRPSSGGSRQRPVAWVQRLPDAG